MPSRILWSLLVSLGMIVSASLSLYGQSTYGSIAGSVTDTSGAAITDAKVTLTNLGTSEKRTQSSGADGLFTFVNLFPGQYRIDVEKQGFKHFVRTRCHGRRAAEHARRCRAPGRRGQPGRRSDFGNPAAAG